MYAEYEYYQSVYGGQLTEEEYNKASKRAANELARSLNNLVQEQPVLDLMLDRIKSAECELTDLFHKFAKEDSKQSTHKDSENEAGYMLNYSSDLEKENKRYRLISGALRSWLTQPVNVIYGGR